MLDTDCFYLSSNASSEQDAKMQCNEQGGDLSRNLDQSELCSVIGSENVDVWMLSDTVDDSDDFQLQVSNAEVVNDSCSTRPDTRTGWRGVCQSPPTLSSFGKYHLQINNASRSLDIEWSNSATNVDNVCLLYEDVNKGDCKSPDDFQVTFEYILTGETFSVVFEADGLIVARDSILIPGKFLLPKKMSVID